MSITSEAVAWQMAQRGAAPSYQVGSLSVEELADLQAQPTTLTFQEYMHLKSASTKQLLTRARGLDHFVPHPSRSEIFYFLVHDTLPCCPLVGLHVNRYREFEMYHWLVQEIFLLLYGSREEYYLATERSPMEGPLRLYNFNIGQPGAEYILAHALDVDFRNDLLIDNHVAILNHLKETIEREKETPSNE